MVPVPWIDVRPSDFVHAAAAGTQAGLESARISQTAQIESARLAQEARAHADMVQQSRDQLSQRAQIAQMENESRTKIAEQNHLREMQGQAILNAYRQQQIALHGENLNREEMAAADKSRQSAMIFQDTQGYAQDIANGITPAVALSRHPHVGTAAASVLQRQAAADREHNYGDIQTMDLPGGGTAVWRAGSPGVHINGPRQNPDERNQSNTQAALFHAELSDLNRRAREKGSDLKPVIPRSQYQTELQSLKDKYLGAQNLNTPESPGPSFAEGTAESAYPDAVSPGPTQDEGAAPARNWMQRALGMGQVPTPTQSAQPANQYQVGRKYGKLIYLGGDPNTPESWQDSTAPVTQGAVQGPDEGSGE